MNILKYPDTFLRLSSDKVKIPLSEEDKALLTLMKKTMYENNGIGLAAIQVGYQKRMCVMDTTRSQSNPIVIINPVIGPKKKDDFHGEIVLSAYQTMVDFNLYPKNKVVIGAFATYSRYAGPREAMFTAICRKNFGCSHFVIGRDHTGVKDFYPPDSSLKIFEKTGDIGIIPIFFDEVAYCQACNNHRTSCKHPDSNILRISGTKVREILNEGSSLLLTLIKNISNDENRFKRINVQKIASLKDLFNSPIKEVLFEIKSNDELKQISKILSNEGKTIININLSTNNKVLKFKLNKTRNLDRKTLNLLRKQQIQAIIA